MTGSTPHDRLHLGFLAAQIGQELSTLAFDIEALQTMLSGMLTAAEPDAELIVQAQALDRAFQSISQLGGVLHRIAEQADPDWSLAAPKLLAPVSLTALARRLAGEPVADPSQDDLELL